MSGLFSAVILIADLWAVVSIFQSRASTATKVVWTALIIILPLVGFIIWLIAGPRPGR